jgi:hypothetical protein
MRVFLLCNLSGKWEIHAEVLSYDRTTNVMRVRLKCGIEHDRIFLPHSKYNRSDFKIETLEDDDNA